jgi:hypothetical protein
MNQSPENEILLDQEKVSLISLGQEDNINSLKTAESNNLILQ